jgi:hypothetical protein
MKQTYILVSTFLLAAQYVAAHGYVKTVTIAGQPFQANYPFGDTGPSGIRKVDDVVPIKGAKNPDVECGIKAQPASLVLSANPGDAMTFDWRGADDSFVSYFTPSRDQRGAKTPPVASQYGSFIIVEFISLL